MHTPGARLARRAGPFRAARRGGLLQVKGRHAHCTAQPTQQKSRTKSASDDL